MDLFELHCYISCKKLTADFVPLVQTLGTVHLAITLPVQRDTLAWEQKTVFKQSIILFPIKVFDSTHLIRIWTPPRHRPRACLQREKCQDYVFPSRDAVFCLSLSPKDFCLPAPTLYLTYQKINWQHQYWFRFRIKSSSAYLQCTSSNVWNSQADYVDRHERKSSTASYYAVCLTWPRYACPYALPVAFLVP